MVCLSVGPLLLLIFGFFDVLWSIAWPVSDLIKDVATSKNFGNFEILFDSIAADLLAMQARRSMLVCRQEEPVASAILAFYLLFLLCKSGRQKWATCSFPRSSVCSVHLFTCCSLVASPPRSTALTRSFASFLMKR